VDRSELSFSTFSCASPSAVFQDNYFIARLRVSRTRNMLISERDASRIPRLFIDSIISRRSRYYSDPLATIISFAGKIKTGAAINAPVSTNRRAV